MATVAQAPALCNVPQDVAKSSRRLLFAGHESSSACPQGRFDAPEPDTPDEQPGPLLVGQSPTMQAGAHVSDEQAVVVSDG